MARPWSSTALDLLRRDKTTCNNCHWGIRNVDGISGVEGGEDSDFPCFPFPQAIQQGWQTIFLHHATSTSRACQKEMESAVTFVPLPLGEFTFC